MDFKVYCDLKNFNVEYWKYIKYFKWVNDIDINVNCFNFVEYKGIWL